MVQIFSVLHTRHQCQSALVEKFDRCIFRTLVLDCFEADFFSQIRVLILHKFPISTILHIFELLSSLNCAEVVFLSKLRSWRYCRPCVGILGVFPPSPRWTNGISSLYTFFNYIFFCCNEVIFDEPRRRQKISSRGVEFNSTV